MITKGKLYSFFILLIFILSQSLLHFKIERFHILFDVLFIISISFFGFQFDKLKVYYLNTKKSEQDLKQIFDKVDAVVWSTDKDTHNRFFNKDIKKIFGHDMNEFHENKKLWKEIIHPEDKYIMDEMVKEIYIKGFSEGEYRIIKDGEIRWLKTQLTIVDGETPKDYKFNGMTIDITSQKNLEIKLKESEYRYRNLLEVCPAPIIIQQENNIIYLNSAAKKTLKIDKWSDMDNIKFLDLMHPAYKEKTISRINKALNDEFLENEEQKMIRLDGKEIFTETNSIGIDYLGEKATMTVFNDVTKRKEAEKIINEMAYHDGLTGLPNRHLLYENLEKCVARANRNNSSFAVMFIDLDGFKKVNDKYGHIVGDKVLKDAANRLSNKLRKYDSIYRYGGDEFIIVIEKVKKNQIPFIAERIISDFIEPFSLKDINALITPSIGISLYPHDTIHIDKLISFADSAMYYVKANGKNNFMLFSDLDNNI